MSPGGFGAMVKLPSKEISVEGCELSADANQANDCSSVVVSRRSGKTRVRIPAAVRHAIYRRYQSRCCYVGDQGRRCHRQAGLQIDHVLPVSRGGGNHLENLRLLCPVHNRVAAADLFGQEFMEQKMSSV